MKRCDGLGDGLDGAEFGWRLERRSDARVCDRLGRPRVDAATEAWDRGGNSIGGLAEAVWVEVLRHSQLPEGA